MDTSGAHSLVLKPIKQKGLISDAILLAILLGKKIIAAEKRLELTVSDEKETQNIFNERKIY